MPNFLKQHFLQICIFLSSSNIPRNFIINTLILTYEMEIHKCLSGYMFFLRTWWFTCICFKLSVIPNVVCVFWWGASEVVPFGSLQPRGFQPEVIRVGHVWKKMFELKILWLSLKGRKFWYMLHYGRPHAKWSKPIIKAHMLHDPTYMRHLEYEDRRYKVVIGLRGEECGVSAWQVQSFSFARWKAF